MIHPSYIHSIAMWHIPHIYIHIYVYVYICGIYIHNYPWLGPSVPTTLPSPLPPTARIGGTDLVPERRGIESYCNAAVKHGSLTGWVKVNHRNQLKPWGDHAFTIILLVASLELIFYSCLLLQNSHLASHFVQHVLVNFSSSHQV